MKKLSTGITGLDEIFLGGLIPNRSYLIMGPAGSGKTILSLQWLINARKFNKKSLYISLSEKRYDIENDIASFGWSLDGIEMIDLVPIKTAQKPPPEEYHVFMPDEVEKSDIWNSIYQAILETKPDNVVIDSVSQLQFLSTDMYQFRKQILVLTKFLNNHNITSMLLFDPTEMENDISITLAVDGILRLRMQNSPGRIIGLRYMELRKIRSSDFLSGYHPFKITNDGIRVFPHIIEKTGKSIFNNQFITSGITKLDEMLGGGIEEGTATIITGPTGSGKSTLASQFIIYSAIHNLPGLIIMFEETTKFMKQRCKVLGAHLDNLIKQKSLTFIKINPMEMYPDELLALVREYVDKGNYKLVMIDSLRGYTLAMEEFGPKTLIPHVNNLITYLTSKQITTFLVNEIESVAGQLKVTERGLSPFSDNIILLRFAERAGEVIKIISCLKKRLGDFQTDSREMNITTSGISLSNKLNNLEGLLTGLRFIKSQDILLAENEHV